MPKLLIAPNAMRGTLSAAAAAAAIATGARRALPEAEILELPIADGGDGTSEILRLGLGGSSQLRRAKDPLGREIEARFALVHAGKTAVIDVASANGLALLAPEERNPELTSSYGTGELISAALACPEVERVILGLGGSATVDGGMGLLSALGAKFRARDGRGVSPVGGALPQLTQIDLGGLSPRTGEVEFIVACDVDSPLLGPAGAARVYGPQKGADPAMVERLEAGLSNLARLLLESTGREVRGVAWGGAAGGIGATMHALLDARLVSGIDLVLDLLQFNQRVEQADCVLTAEGRLDAGSLCHKGPVGVARRAARANVPTLAIVGTRDPELDLSLFPFSDVIQTAEPGAMTPPDRATAIVQLETASERVLRRWRRF